MWAVFKVCCLQFSTVYQSIALMQGKSLAEIIKEIKDAAFAIFGK